MYSRKGDISLKPMDRDIDQYMEVMKRDCLLIQDNSKLQYITNQSKQGAKNAYWEYKKTKNGLGTLWLLV